MTFLGYGVGLRTQHFDDLLQHTPGVDWLEIISENFMIAGGRPLAVLDKVRRDVPVVMHGVSMALGSVDPLSQTYLQELKALAQRIEPAWISDHLCWGSHGGHYAHDLLPLPHTEEALAHVVERVCRVQDILGRQILLENVSSYITFDNSSMPEWQFLAELAERADCGILLDVNNVFVSAFNHGFSARDYIQALPAQRVRQIHIAGHAVKGDYLLDTHDTHVSDDVWDLYRLAIKTYGPVSTLLEWDDHLPSYPELVAECWRAKEKAHPA